MGDIGTVTSHGERAEVNCILQSAAFVRSPRLARLLEYLCAKYFAGEVDQIKEYSIAVEVLDRPASFDPAEDAIARVEVHRLRKKLREYYAAEGASNSLRVVIPTGRYAPVFVAADHASDEGARGSNDSGIVSPATGTGDGCPPLAEQIGMRAHTPLWRRPGTLTVAGLVLCAALIVLLRARPVAASHPHESAAAAGFVALSPAAAAVLPAVTGEEIRILCGQRSPHTDRMGRTWAADRYFEGGDYWEPPRQFLARTFDQSLYQGARAGEFSYHIPLPPGVYELHLYFAETAFGPGTAGGSGENTRVFHVAVNGKRLLSDFDIISDAGGPGIADERVFKDISPGPDGVLQLRFMSQRSQPIVNAIAVEPARTHLLNPVRIYVQDKPYTDSHRSIWMPDNFWSGGQFAAGSAFVEGSQDPGLYAKERYGHFSYAIPVDQGRYGVTLHFAETYWGLENPGGGGVGSRVFDVYGNGMALVRNLDIYKEAGGSRALLKTFHGLESNAQGKLMLSFVPVHNYATIRAIEVVDESR